VTDPRSREFADKIIQARMVRDFREVKVKDWAIPEDSHLLRTPAAFRDDVVGQFADKTPKGDALPAAKTHNLLRFRSHEVSVWIGYNRSFKSVFINEIMSAWACARVPVCLASFEMPAVRLVRLAVQQVLADSDPDVNDIDRAIERLADAMTIYDIMGRVPPMHLIAVMRYCAVELGIRHFLVDNLTNLLPAGNDHTDKHQAFLNDCLMIARTTGMHIHLVGHCAKPERGDVGIMPNRYSLRGSGSVVDGADNVLICWRNQPKEDKIEADKADDFTYKEPDFMLKADKQKFGAFEGIFNYWIDRRCLRFQEYGTSVVDAMI
jgi:twinkle protein